MILPLNFFSVGKMELKPATIKCKNCDQESYIESWRVGVNAAKELVRVCPECDNEEVVG